MNALVFVTEEAVEHIEQVPVRCLTLEQLGQNSFFGPVDFFLINGAVHATYIEAVCRAIRQKANPDCYLRPIVLVNCPPNLPGHLERIADSIVSAGNLAGFGLQQVKDMAQPINRRIAELPEYQQKTDVQLSLKILRYLFSRQMELVPYRSSLTLHGLHYPEIETFLGQDDESVFNLLDFLEDQKLVSSRFFEKVHLCNQCHSSYINFLESCPHCRSADLRQDSLVHHFPCAHVAPEEEFRQHDRLVCPKCEHGLQGLGVDYDKPSSVYQCNQCQHTTQEPTVTTICFHCGAQSAPEDLRLRVVKSYALNALGANAAQYGLDNLFQRVLENEISMLPLPAFKVVVGIEGERIKRYAKSTSSLALFQISDLDSIYRQLGARHKDMFQEMGAIIKSVLRTCDITTAINESTFLSLLPETDALGASTAMHRLQEKFVTLFASNLQAGISVKTNTVAIPGDRGTDELLAVLMNNATVC